MYEKEIAQKPWMLDVSYLIFGYDMTEDGIVTIKKVWLKKVWELSRPMKSGNNKTVWPINLQIKQGTVHKIRPAKWYGISKDFAVYSNMEDFLAAMEETVYKNKDTRDDGPDWLSTLIKNYKDFYGIDLNLPRWKDIERKYVLR